MKLNSDTKTYLIRLQETIASLSTELIDQVVVTLLECAHAGQRVFIFGNGGSAATASHFACDLSKNTVILGAPPFRAIALTDNIALMTAWANDTAYDNVFAAQLSPLVQPGDVVIAISCSGNSANVLKAMIVARQQGATTIGFTGDQGGQLKDLVDICIPVPSPYIEHQEDVHLILEHCICAAIRDELSRQYAPVPYEITSTQASQEIVSVATRPQ